MWDLIVSVPDHCLSFYYTKHTLRWSLVALLRLVYYSFSISVAESLRRRDLVLSLDNGNTDLLEISMLRNCFSEYQMFTFFIKIIRQMAFIRMAERTLKRPL